MYKRFWHQFFHTAIQLLYLKLAFGVWINFQVMEKQNFLKFLSSFVSVFFFITLIILTSFYTFVGFHSLRKSNPKGWKQWFIWGSHYNDEKSYKEQEMPNTWLTHHFQFDINIRKPLACFHHLVMMLKKWLIVIYLVKLRFKAYDMLIMFLLFNFGS